MRKAKFSASRRRWVDGVAKPDSMGGFVNHARNHGLEMSPFGLFYLVESVTNRKLCLQALPVVKRGGNGLWPVLPFTPFFKNSR